LKKSAAAFSHRSEAQRTEQTYAFASSLAAALLDGLFEPPFGEAALFRLIEGIIISIFPAAWGYPRQSGQSVGSSGASHSFAVKGKSCSQVRQVRISK